MVLGVFSNRNYAEQAIMDLESSGFDPKDISIVMKDHTHASNIAESTGASVAEGAVSGGTTGAVVGGLAGLLIGIGAVAIPGLGGILIGGPLVAALGLSGAAATTVSGAVTGAVAGGLLGALMGLGVSEDDAKFYEDRVKEGAILIAVPDTGRRDMVIDILEDNNAENIRTVADYEPSYAKMPRPSKYDDPYYSGNAGYVGVKGGEVDEKYRDVDNDYHEEHRENSVMDNLKEMVTGKKRSRR
jgi:hypothetical protein